MSHFTHQQPYLNSSHTGLPDNLISRYVNVISLENHSNWDTNTYLAETSCDAPRHSEVVFSVKLLLVLSSAHVVTMVLCLHLISDNGTGFRADIGHWYMMYNL